MTVFARVATVRSFSAAARELGISQATASKHVQILENSLGTRLLHRTTRRVVLTDYGINFYTLCCRILEDMDNAWQAGQSVTRLSGHLRIAAPVTFGTVRLAPLLSDFMQQHPGLVLSVSLTDRAVDIANEGYDLAIRIGPGFPDRPGLHVRRLMPLPLVLCAAPEFLTTAGQPATPADLARLACVADGDQWADTVWRFRGPGGVSEVTMAGRLRTNSALLSRDAARAGIGVVLVPEFLVADDLAAGRLVRMLPGYEPAEEQRLDAVCLEDRAATPRLARLISFLAERL